MQPSFMARPHIFDAHPRVLSVQEGERGPASLGLIGSLQVEKVRLKEWTRTL